MKVEKFKVLLYLKKSEPDKTGKAPIMGRITLNRTMAQFSCKLSCTPGLWNARESRLNGKSREAVETNEKIERLLLAVHSAFNSLMERKRDFDAAAVRDMFQGNAGMQMTLLKLLDRHNGEMKARVGVDRAPTTLSTYLFTYRTLSEFIKAKFKVPDLVFGQLNEQFIRDYQDFILLEKGYAVDTLRGYLAILKKICRIAYKEGHSEKYHFCHFKLPKQKETTPKALSREIPGRYPRDSFPAAGLPHAQGQYEIPAPDGRAEPGPCLPHGTAFFRLAGHARGGSADRDHLQNAGTLQHKDHPDIRARNPEEAVRGHGQVRRGNPRFETYPLIPKQSLSCAVHSSSYSTSTVTR